MDDSGHVWVNVCACVADILVSETSFVTHEKRITKKKKKDRDKLKYLLISIFCSHFLSFEM